MIKVQTFLSSSFRQEFEGVDWQLKVTDSLHSLLKLRGWEINVVGSRQRVISVAAPRSTQSKLSGSLAIFN